MSIVKSAFLKNGQQRVVYLRLGRVILLVFLPHLHLITGLSIDGLLENSNEDVLGLLSATLLVDSLVGLVSQCDLTRHVLLLHRDLLHAVHLKFVVLFLDLLLLGLFLIFVVNVIDVGVSNQVISAPLLIASSNLTLLVVIVDEDLVHDNIELRLFDLIGCGKLRVQFKLLSHLVDQDVLAVVVLLELDSCGSDLSVGREGD